MTRQYNGYYMYIPQNKPSTPKVVTERSSRVQWLVGLTPLITLLSLIPVLIIGLFLWGLEVNSNSNSQYLVYLVPLLILGVWSRKVSNASRTPFTMALVALLPAQIYVAYLEFHNDIIRVVVHTNTLTFYATLLLIGAGLTLLNWNLMIALRDKLPRTNQVNILGILLLIGFAGAYLVQSLLVFARKF